MSNVINIPSRPENPDIQAQAREWVVKLDGERPAPAVLAELRLWANRSPLHRQALEQAAAAWNAMDSLAGLLGPHETASTAVPSVGQAPPDAPAAASASARPTAAAAARSTSAAEGDTARRAGRYGLPAARVTVAALLVLVVAIIAYRFLPGVLTPDVPAIRYATAVGEIKTLTLPDGSEVRLNTNSAVRVAFPGKARVIQLDGEAYFKVAPDPRRPFVVYAGRFSVKALGTAFAVHALENGVDLTVTAGHVELASLKEPPADVASRGVAPTDHAETRVSLLKGQHAYFHGESKLIESLDTQALEERLSWRDGMLIFDNDRLSDIVAELNRYSTTRIVISEPATQDLRLGGYFKVRDIGSILETLRGYGLHVERVNDRLIYLSRMN
ncbi:MAG: FecR domain-containing protein [Gammaproteobacteria bacterium]